MPDTGDIGCGRQALFVRHEFRSTVKEVGAVLCEFSLWPRDHVAVLSVQAMPHLRDKEDALVAEWKHAGDPLAKSYTASRS